jgi:competence protein ComEA
MQFGRMALAGMLAAALGSPVAAQTTQSTPGKSSPTITAAPGASTRTPSTVSSSKLVDINSASAADLDALPGVGKARAEAIIKNRPYKGKDDLTNRHIIPQNVYDGIKDKIIAKQS